MTVSRFWQILLAADINPGKARKILESFEPSLPVTVEEFCRNPLLSPTEKKRALATTFEAFESAMHQGDTVLSLNDLPPAYTEVEWAPPTLFHRGTPTGLMRPAIGIVGTRSASTYGKAVAKKFASSFAERGLTVLSGGAVGIDQAAHEGALSAQGSTYAVLAGGLDRPYPSINGGLFKRMEERGGLLSAYAYGSLPEPYRFLARNSVIAAFSVATLVVEAPARSGALNTARHANDLGRPVFVVPANIDAESFKGSHELIRDGATLVTSPDQVLEDLALNLSLPFESVASEPPSAMGGTILQALSVSPIPLEKIAEITQISPEDLLAELTMLELEGHVIRDLGGYARTP